MTTNEDLIAACEHRVNMQRPNVERARRILAEEVKILEVLERRLDEARERSGQQT